MANLKRGPVAYRPFAASAILADGLLAIDRPGGELQRQLADSLFSTARMFGQIADREADKLGRQRYADDVAAGRQSLPGVEFSGGGIAPQPPPEGVPPAPAAPGKPLTEPPRDDRAPPGTYVPTPPKTQPKAEPKPAAAAVPAGVSAEVRDAIQQAAARHNVPLSVMVRIAAIETGGTFNPRAKNPTSTAGGLYQQIDANAAQYGVRDRFDPYQSADGAARFLRDNMAYLTRKLGRPPTAGELYLAHQQGPLGAAMLLANPAAPAASVVGLDKVLKNGGSRGMTAGEFARLWTSKAGDQPGQPGVQPVFSAENVRTPLSTTFTGGKLALTGRDTIYGRAYDEAASRAYMAALQDTMLTTADRLFQQYGDQPEELRGALDQMKAEQLKAHVPEELRLDYELAFGRIERGLMAKAQIQRDRIVDQENRSIFDQAATGYGEQLARAQEGLDPENPESLDLAAGHAARLKEHLREGVARGYLTQGQYDDAAAKLDGDVAVTWFTRQAEGLPPEEVAALRDSLKADYAAGKLANVDAAAWKRIDVALTQMERTGEVNARQAARQVNRAAASIVERAADGHDIAPAELDGLRAAAAGVADGAEIVADTVALVDLARALKGGPLAEAEKQLDAMRKEIGNAPTERQAARLKSAEALVQRARQQLAADPLGYAFRAGVIADPGAVTDVQSPDDLQALLGRREDMADQVQDHFGVAGQIFRPGEAAALEGLARTDPQRGAEIAGAVIRATAQPARMLKEFGKAAPVMTAAGAIMASSGNVQAAADAIAGAGKGPDGRDWPAKGAKARRAQGLGLTGVSLMWQPNDERRILDAAEWIARKRLGEQGIEPDDEQAAAIYAQAVQEAAGATFSGEVQYGGFAPFDAAGYFRGEQQVMVPPSIRADMVFDVIAALKDGDTAVGPKGGMAILTQYWPVLTAYGYVFVDFDADGEPMPINGEDGKPFVVNLETLAAKLGPRVPGAFKGY